MEAMLKYLLSSLLRSGSKRLVTYTYKRYTVTRRKDLVVVVTIIML
jgi:hypothetical protein